jgi:CheY-like chemotaxis protein
LDTGIGIPEDQLEEIFNEFHQLQNPARDRQQGLGLGLAIVKRLAKLLDYKIKVTSRLGHGSCFSITVPLAKRNTRVGARLQQALPQVEVNILADREVLVLDDDVAVLQGMSGLLTHWGCQVTTATSPAEAELKLAAMKHKLELLIIDYRLPEHVSGIQLAGQIQSRLDYPLAVLIITGDTEPERLQEANASGYPLLHKPVQPAKLRSTLQYLFSQALGQEGFLA